MRQSMKSHVGRLTTIAGTIFLVIVPACKPKGDVSEATSRPAETPGLVAQSGLDKTDAAVPSDLEAIPYLGRGVGYIAAGGEGWTKYSNGLMNHDLRPGTPGKTPMVGQTVTVAYVGMFADSKQIFDSAPKEKPFSFVVGSKYIIKGWNLAIVAQTVGGLRRIYVPPELAYGSAGHPPVIGPDQALIFEIELLSITGDAVQLPPVLPAPQPLGPPAPNTATSAPASGP